MVPKKEGGATSLTESNAWGIHDNPVSSNHPPSTVTMKRQWKHRYLPHTYHDKRDGQARNKKLSANYPIAITNAE